MTTKIRIIDDLKRRNADNMETIAGEYFGSKFTYAETFKMFEDYKRAFLDLEGTSDNPITISAPSTIASVNALYGAFDANKTVNLSGPGFLFAYTDKYIKDIHSETVLIFDSFLNEEFITKLYKAGVKNLISISVTDYMNPMIKTVGQAKGIIPRKDFYDEYVKAGNKIPSGMQFIRLREFAKAGAKSHTNISFPYEENKIAAYFLTGATTSRMPKCVKIYADGLNKMAEIYDNLWFDFHKGIRQTVFIPLFYATGAVHGVHAGLFSGMTLTYQPRYDRFAFAKDLSENNTEICLVAPSHVATLENSGLPDGALKRLKYIFIGGEAIMPAQMRKFRQEASRLGIQYILNGYGMTETASMTGISDKIPTSDDDVTVAPVPGVKYRIVDPVTRKELGDNQRGILEKWSPCATAGYFEEEHNQELFTKDGWINTGDVAMRFSDGKYRIFGRGSDCFENGGNVYAMFDIEEKVLEHPGIFEAEVIKFSIKEKEYPAIVVVLKADWKSRQNEVLKYISEMTVPGIEYLIGTRFIDNFKTNPITSKRDYLCLPDEKTGYLKYDTQSGEILLVEVGD